MKPLLALFCLYLWMPTSAFAYQNSDYSKVMGPNECAECHERSSEIWKESHHFSTVNTMHRSEKAQKIAKKLGIKRIKADSQCMDCHYTTQLVQEKPKVIAGISCESCHGAAKDWLERHSEYSSKKKETESKAEAKQRWADSEAAGMIRPHMLYTLAKNCYSCHITPKEDLVNIGGHSPGSPFELMSWSQGEVRHSVWHNKAGKNIEASTERKRMMFILGAAVELEESFKAVGQATKKAKYAVTMAKRAKLAAKRLNAIAKLVNVPELNDMVKIIKSTKLRLNNQAELETASAKIGELASRFSTAYDGSTFAAVDSILPSPAKYKGKIQP